MSSLQQSVRRFLWLRYIPGVRFWTRLRYRREHPMLARELFGLRFQHPVGLAPVFERQVDLLDACEDLGFSFVGIAADSAPVKTIAQRLQERKNPIIASIELRPDGPSEEQAQRTMIRRYSLLYDFTDLFIVDINRESGQSSLDDISDWTDLLDELLDLRLCYEKYRPILLRISPSHTEEQMARILDFCRLSGIDGVVVPGIPKIRFCSAYCKGRLPIVGSGAVTVPEEAVGLLQAGASLVEVAQGLKKNPCTTSKVLLKAIDNPFQSL